MTDEQKEEMIAMVIDDCDFDVMRSYIVLRRKRAFGVPTVDELKKEAEYLLRRALEHSDRDSWWITRHCFVAYIHKRWGLNLLFVPERSRSFKFNFEEL